MHIPVVPCELTLKESDGSVKKALASMEAPEPETEEEGEEILSSFVLDERQHPRTPGPILVPRKRSEAPSGGKGAS